MKADTTIDTIYLDVQNMTIFDISDDQGRFLKHKIDSPNPVLGDRLTIYLQEKIHKSDEIKLRISYETSSQASAVSWLTPEQTAGKKLPYMFTQCESIFCRSIAPLQDTPSIKSTYTVNTTTIADITTRVSGNLTSEFRDESYRYTSFEMNIPVQSYLLAIASGNLVERKIGERTSVITEPEEIEKVANEFEHLEDYLNEAEKNTIPYEWGEYKLLILPPSFPFGGMENPLLTFASPAIVPGDKSSVDVAIHEIAHSWFGNLVTNNNWTNFWLNEGFTVFLERTVVNDTFGVNFMKVTAKLENQSMYYDMVDYGLDNSFSSLYPIFHGENPDDAFSTIPYEKGFQFLYYIETLIGREKIFEYLRTYLDKFGKQSLRTADFIETMTGFINKSFSKKEAKSILGQIDFETWIYKPGLPPVTLDFGNQDYDNAVNLADEFINGHVDPVAAAKMYHNFSVNLKGLFINRLIDNVDRIDDCKAAYIQDKLKIKDEINGEIIFRWLQVSIRSYLMNSPYKEADEFVGSIGRLKFISPVYSALNDRDPKMAREIYEKHKDFYHPIARDTIEAILNDENILISD